MSDFQLCLQCDDNPCKLGDDGRQLLSLQMLSEQFKLFLEAVKADARLQEQLKSAMEPDAVVALATDLGFMISTEELKNAQAEFGKLSDEELEGIAGGILIGCTYQLSYRLG